MGIKAYLLSGVNLKEDLVNIHNYIKRDSLLIVPDVLKIDQKIIDDNYLFYNKLNCCVGLTFYGEFNSAKDAFNDYKKDFTQYYNIAYEKFKILVKQEFNEDIQDSEWCTLICIDENYTPSNNEKEEKYRVTDEEIIIPEISTEGKDSKYFIALLECSFICQAISRIISFTKTLKSSKKLSKIEQFKLNYYSQEIYKISNPELYLTSVTEIRVTKNIFNNWGLETQIANVVGLLNQSIDNYSFLWQYENSEYQSSLSSFVAIFTLLISYSDLKSMIQDIFPQIATYFPKIYLSILSVLIIRVGVIYLKRYIEKRNFNNKIKKVFLK